MMQQLFAGVTDRCGRHSRLLKCVLLGIALTVIATGCNSAPKIVPAKLKKIESTRSAKTVWTTSIGGGGSRPAVRFAPFVTDDTIFTASASGKLTSVSRESGSTNWSVDIGQELTAGISGDNQFLFVATGDGNVFCVRQLDGSSVWNARVSSEVIAAPVAGLERAGGSAQH